MLIRYSSKILNILLLASLCLPLLFTPATMFPWHFGKTMVFQIMVEAATLCYTISLLGGLRSVRRLSLLDWSLVIFLLFSVVTALIGGSFGFSWWGNQSRANGIFVFIHFAAWYALLSHEWRTKEDWVLGCMIAVGVGLVVSFTGFFPAVLPGAWIGVGGGRASGIVGNPAFLASYLVPVIAISFLGCLISVKQWQRYVFLAAVPVFVTAIIYTATRGAWLGLLAGSATALVVASLHLPRCRTKQVTLGLLTAGVLAAGTLWVLVATNSTLLAVVPRLKSLSAISFTSGTAATRLMAWHIAWEGIRLKPVTGYGWGNYGIVFNQFYNPHFLRSGLSETVWDKPHNWVLELAVNGGVILVLSYLAIVAIAAYYVVRGRMVFLGEQPVMTALVRAVLVGGLVACLVQGLFLFETSFSLWGWFFLLAFINALILMPTTDSGRTFRLQPEICAGISIVSAVAVVCLVYYGSIIPLRASHQLLLADNERDIQAWATFGKQALLAPKPWREEVAVLLARRLTRFNNQPNFQLTDRAKITAEAVITELDAASIRAPRVLDFPLWAGQVYQVLGQQTTTTDYYVRAESEFARARAISPRKQEVLFLLTKLYLSEQKFEQAIAMQTEAIALDPEIGLSHWLLGIAYAAAQKPAEAVAAIEAAEQKEFALTRAQELYVIELYAGLKRYDQVIVRFKRIHEAEPTNLEWAVKLATAYALGGQKAEALALARQIATDKPDMADEVAAFIKQYRLDIP